MTTRRGQERRIARNRTAPSTAGREARPADTTSVRESIKTTLFESEDLAGTRQFRCGEGWETAKNQGHRSSCPECFANDVTEIGWTA